MKWRRASGIFTAAKWKTSRGRTKNTWPTKKQERRRLQRPRHVPGIDALQFLHSARPAAAPEDHAHWKLKPPRWPVTSRTSPIKNNPRIFLVSIVLLDNSSVSTPPAVTSAFS